MFSYLSSLSGFDAFSFSSLAMIGAIGTILSLSLLFARIVFTYKKGILYAEKNGNVPKLREIHYVFFIIGVFAPWALSFIPFIGIIFNLISLFLLVKILPELVGLNHVKKIKPEKMLKIGFALGLSGVIAFMFGIYRQLNEKDEDLKEIENVNQASKL